MTRLPPPGRPLLFSATFRGFPAMALSTMVARYVPAEAWSRGLANVRPELRDELLFALAELEMAGTQYQDWRASEFGAAAVDDRRQGASAAAAEPSGHEIDTRQAADVLGVTANRVRQLCREGHLQARQVGRTWLVDVAAVRLRAVA